MIQRSTTRFNNSCIWGMLRVNIAILFDEYEFNDLEYEPNSIIFQEEKKIHTIFIPNFSNLLINLRKLGQIFDDKKLWKQLPIQRKKYFKKQLSKSLGEKHSLLLLHIVILFSRSSSGIRNDIITSLKYDQNKVVGSRLFMYALAYSSAVQVFSIF